MSYDGTIMNAHSHRKRAGSVEWVYGSDIVFHAFLGFFDLGIFFTPQYLMDGMERSRPYFGGGSLYLPR
jgi:hypothetical protein